MLLERFVTTTQHVCQQFFFEYLIVAVWLIIVKSGIPGGMRNVNERLYSETGTVYFLRLMSWAVSILFSKLLCWVDGIAKKVETKAVGRFVH